MAGWSYCNQYIANRWEGYEADIWEKMEHANQTAFRSTAIGFHFDNTAVAEQIHQCDLVCDEYLNSLQEGVLDPDTALPAFRQALKDAGIDEIIAEKQRQLDQFLRQPQ